MSKELQLRQINNALEVALRNADITVQYNAPHVSNINSTKRKSHPPSWFFTPPYQNNTHELSNHSQQHYCFPYDCVDKPIIESLNDSLVSTEVCLEYR